MKQQNRKIVTAMEGTWGLGRSQHRSLAPTQRDKNGLLSVGRAWQAQALVLEGMEGYGDMVSLISTG